MQVGARVAWLVVAALCALGAGCCGSGAMGELCLDSAGGDGGAMHIVSPALECHSRLCLVTPRAGGATALCTTECSTDRDCEAMDGLYCRSGHACARVSPYPRAVCICR